MYGLVNRALQQLVCTQHGKCLWTEIRSRAGVADEVFLRMESYPDEMTYGLVASASEVLDAPAELLLKEFGRYWVRYTMVEGYGALLSDLGPSFQEALAALDGMHARVALLYPALKPPRFSVSDVAQDRVSLHYRSERSGLAPMIIGLVEGLGERYQLRIAVTHAVAKEDSGDHDRFDIRILERHVSDGVGTIHSAAGNAVSDVARCPVNNPATTPATHPASVSAPDMEAG